MYEVVVLKSDLLSGNGSLDIGIDMNQSKKTIITVWVPATIRSKAMRTKLFYLVVLFATLFTSGAWAQDKVTPDQAKAIAKEAYIFNYPLVMMYRTMYLQAIDTKSKSYTADQLPPAKNFWSFTMYKLPQRWLVDNPINRYSIGSPTPGLKTAKDGSITLYFSVKSPGKDKESNWFPAPEGPFWLVLRTYGPGKTILDKTWKVPPVKQVK
jgi:hypothetical protein